MSLTRHKIREIAFQTLFALNSNIDADPIEVEKQVLSESNPKEDVPEYLTTLVKGVLDNQSEIDGIISSYLKKGWSLPRLNKTDLLILRVAVYEIKYVDDVPSKVALNEALQLAKEFSDEKSKRFINGILANLVE